MQKRKTENKGGNPLMSKGELAAEIARRTGIPAQYTKAMVDAYGQIVEDCLMGGVDVKIGEVCYLCSEIQQPGTKRYYDVRVKQMVEQFKPGHRRVRLFVTPAMRTKLKRSTWFWPEGYTPTDEEMAYIRKCEADEKAYAERKAKEEAEGKEKKTRTKGKK